MKKKKLHELGFQTWYERVCELARENINIETKLFEIWHQIGS